MGKQDAANEGGCLLCVSERSVKSCQTLRSKVVLFSKITRSSLISLVLMPPIAPSGGKSPSSVANCDGKQLLRSDDQGKKVGENPSSIARRRRASDVAGDLPAHAARRPFDFEPPPLMWSTETEQSHN